MKHNLKIWRQRFAYYWKWNSLGVIMSATTALISLIAVIIITMIIYRRYEYAINESTKQNNIQVVQNVAQNIDSYIKEMISISSDVTELLNEYSIEDSMKSIHFFLRSDVNTIAVFDRKGNTVLAARDKDIKLDNKTVQEQEWFQQTVPGSTIYYVSSPHVQRLYQGEYPWVISLSRGVSWVDEQGNYHQGIMLIDLNFNNIREVCSNELGNNGYTFVISDEDGELVYHPRQQMIYAGVQQDSDLIRYALLIDNSSEVYKLNDTNYVISTSTLKNTFHWTVVGINPLDGLFSYDSEFKKYITIGITCIVILILLLALAVSIFITRPMRRLMLAMQRAESGELEPIAEIKGSYEVKKLSLSFNQMMLRLKQLMDQVIAEQKQLRKTEMRALHAQINPHFLYNTLDSIVWMAESGDMKNVVKMVDALANFFRLSLAKGKDVINVKEEFQHIENYLIIQQMRYDDQFKYNLTAEPEVLQMQTLNIILQPIVENAIIHGVGNLPYEGEIEICAYCQNNMLIYEVKDNGFGIKQDLLKNILEQNPSKKSGIGIKNVNQRIQLMYGNSYGLKYESELDEGTTVFIYLPIIDKNGEVVK